MKIWPLPLFAWLDTWKLFGGGLKEGGKPLSRGLEENIKFTDHLPHFRQNNLFLFFTNLRLQFLSLLTYTIAIIF